MAEDDARRLKIFKSNSVVIYTRGVDRHRGGAGIHQRIGSVQAQSISTAPAAMLEAV